MEVYHLAKPGRWHSSSCWENSVNLMKAQTKTEAWKDNLPWKDKRQLSSIKHWNCFKGNIGETSEKQGGAHMGFSEHTDTIFNWTRFFFKSPPGNQATTAFSPWTLLTPAYHHISWCSLLAARHWSDMSLDAESFQWVKGFATASQAYAEPLQRRTIFLYK